MDNLVNKLKLDKPVPLMCRYIHKIIINRESKRIKDVPIDEELLERQLICMVVYDFGIPKHLLQPFFEEMEFYNLIKIENKQKIRIIRAN